MMSRARNRLCRLLAFAGFGSLVLSGLAEPFVTETAGAVRFRNTGAELVIERTPWKLRFAHADGGARFSEATAPGLLIGGVWREVAAVTGVKSDDARATLQLTLSDGTPADVGIERLGADGFKITVRAPGAKVDAVRGAAVLDPVEEIYGFGEMWNGRVAQRGSAFELWDRGGTPDECAYMPYYVSTRNYAFFLDYGGRVRFDVGQTRADRLTFEAPVSELALTLVAGTSIPTTVHHFLREIGLPQRPPRWAFKPWFWLMADPDQPGGKITTLRGAHFPDMVRRLRQLNIPIGVTWFEPPWQTARNSFVPNSAFHADQKALVQELRALGVRTLAWSVPYTTPEAENWREAVARGYLVRKPGAEAADAAVKISGTGELAGQYYNAIDFFNPEAFAWWRGQIERSLDLGLAGYKPDAGQDLPEDAIVHGGRAGRDVHNSYAREYNRVFFEALKNRLGDDFLMVPRAAWVGSSALTNFKWPGDLAGTFGDNGLPSSVYSSLSLAFCGLPFVSTDIGGFDDQPAPEAVWLRWAQFGAMLPGMQTLHMPWWYSEKALRHFRYLAWLHTDLAPLWNTLAHEAAATGAPVIRPLVWTAQEDVAGWRVDDQFTVGRDLMVAPIMNSNYERPVYLPPGRWYDFWDGNAQTFEGPLRFHWTKGWFVHDRFPLFIREGAIIPLEVTNAESGFGWAESSGYLTLALWPKVRGASEFVLNDLAGPVRIAAEWGGDDRLVISWGETKQNHLLRVHLGAPVKPAAVTSGGKPLARFDSLEAFRAGGEGWCHDAASAKLWVRKFNSGAAGAVEVRLVP